MRILAGLCLFLSACASSVADSGYDPRSVSSASSLTPGNGVAVLSVRSEMFLDVPLELYFLREGGDIANDADIAVFERERGAAAMSSGTVGYDIRAVQLQPGTYRLVAHGMNCPNVPVIPEECTTQRRTMGTARTVYRPSRNYVEPSFSFTIREGAVTYVGDLALTARNHIAWSPIPPAKLASMQSRFGALRNGPRPEVPDRFRLRYALDDRSFGEDIGRRY